MGGYVYHVLHRAVGRATLFYQEGDYAAFENTLREAKEWQPIRLLAYALMPNHWHWFSGRNTTETCRNSCAGSRSRTPSVTTPTTIPQAPARSTKGAPSRSPSRQDEHPLRRFRSRAGLISDAHGKNHAKQFNEMVNFQSGLLGISETSSDMRDLIDHETQDVRASEAVKWSHSK